MRVLALETSSRAASIAALDGDQLIEQIKLPAESRTAQSLTPAIAQLLKSHQWRPEDVELVAVTEGPGSFTGLRLGVTTAKTFSYGTGAQVIGVNTLAVIADQAPVSVSSVWAVIDAQRRQLFAARFRREGGQLTCADETQILDNTAWIGQLQTADSVAGTGLSKLKPQIPAGVQIVDQADWAPRAITVGRLALREWNAGRRDDCWSLVPRYYRQSAAEEKLAEK